MSFAARGYQGLGTRWGARTWRTFDVGTRAPYCERGHQERESVTNEEWQGTRAGGHASAVIIVKEDDGMPWIDFQPGDINKLILARCFQSIVDALTTAENFRLAEEVLREQGLTPR